MAATVKTSGTKSVFIFSGKLDAKSSHIVDLQLKKTPRFVDEIIFNFAALEYISSMGLRLVLKAYKMMEERGGKFTCSNIPDHIKHVFEISGFIGKIVADEKTAIIRNFVLGNAASFYIFGDLERDKALDFKEQVEILVGDGVTNLQVNCKGLNTISNDSYPVLTDIQKSVSKKDGSLALINISDQLKDDLSKSNLKVLLEEKEKEIIPTNEIEVQILKKRINEK
ncbi:hypothetical protein FACS189494_07080 [Spirochaetia bacterium]|nr:hypothetical protein FACS189494_07080 [Spirochaetia bacterium]